VSGGGIKAGTTRSAALSNRRLKLTGAFAGHRDEWLVGSRTRSLARRLGWCTFAPAA
jgi:hypothetical protein